MGTFGVWVRGQVCGCVGSGVKWGVGWEVGVDWGGVGWSGVGLNIAGSGWTVHV